MNDLSTVTIPSAGVSENLGTEANDMGVGAAPLPLEGDADLFDPSIRADADGGGTVKISPVPGSVQSIADAILGKGTLPLDDVVFFEFENSWSDITTFDGDLPKADRASILSLEWDDVNGVGFVSSEGQPFALIQEQGIAEAAREQGVPPAAYRDYVVIQEITGAAMLDLLAEAGIDPDLEEGELLTEVLAISTADGGVDSARALSSLTSIYSATAETGSNPQYSAIREVMTTALEAVLKESGVTPESRGLGSADGQLALEFEIQFIDEVLDLKKAGAPIPSTRDLMVTTFERFGLDGEAALSTLVQRYGEGLGARLEASPLPDQLEEAQAEDLDDWSWPFW